MGDKTGIAWTNATWNPVRGCSMVSAGCTNCYAMSIAARFSGPGQAYERLAKPTPSGPRWTGKVAFVESVLEQPIRWKKPRRIFVNSMSDLFHESIPDEWIDQIFAVMALAHRHTFQVLTKRPERMLAYFADPPAGSSADAPWRWTRHMRDIGGKAMEIWEEEVKTRALRNVWLGVSVENQETADERLPLLLKTPAAVRFISYEPALGPVDFYRWTLGDSLRRLSWIIVGGESGPGARPFDLEWARETIKQCQAAGVGVFMKQIGARPWWNGLGPPPAGHVYLERDVILNGQNGWRLDCLKDRAGADPEEWPRDMRVQEFP